MWITLRVWAVWWSQWGLLGGSDVLDHQTGPGLGIPQGGWCSACFSPCYLSLVTLSPNQPMINAPAPPALWLVTSSTQRPHWEIQRHSPGTPQNFTICWALNQKNQHFKTTPRTATPKMVRFKSDNVKIKSIRHKVHQSALLLRKHSSNNKFHDSCGHAMGESRLKTHRLSVKTQFHLRTFLKASFSREHRFSCKIGLSSIALCFFASY